MWRVITFTPPWPAARPIPEPITAPAAMPTASIAMASPLRVLPVRFGDSGLTPNLVLQPDRNVLVVFAGDRQRFFAPFHVRMLATLRWTHVPERFELADQLPALDRFQATRLGRVRLR